eukprot:c17583_g2_i4.p1 GENE.c17583_g2_i4~~c17583_g2_i4.p1  ORF type:complete len:488 (+),score=86.00 c17583_g2_i4:473-1936(+)
MTMLQVGEYDVFMHRELGAGSFGTVVLGLHRQTRQEYAVKVIPPSRLSNPRLRAALKLEIHLMHLLPHPNIVQIHKVFATSSGLLIFMELVRAGDLLTLIERLGYLDEITAMRYFDAILNGVEACHSLNICHRDLKPENLLVCDQSVIKIADFGTATFAHTTSLHSTECGTINYSAPEKLTGQGYDGKTADVWSLGCILYVMLAGQLPFPSGSRSFVSRLIQNGRYEPLPPHVSENAHRLIRFILEPNPSQRPTIQQIRAHATFASHCSLASLGALLSIAPQNGFEKPLERSSVATTTRSRLPNATACVETWQPPKLTVFELVLRGLESHLDDALDQCSPIATHDGRRSLSSSEDEAGESEDKISNLSTAFQTAKRSASLCRFTATSSNPSAIITTLTHSLETMNVHSVIPVPAAFTIKVRREFGEKPCMTVRLFELSPPVPKTRTEGVYIVEVSRAQGSQQTFLELFDQLMKCPKIKKLVSRPTHR